MYSIEKKEKNIPFLKTFLTKGIVYATMSISDMSHIDISDIDIVRVKDRKFSENGKGRKMQMEEKIRKKYCPMTETTFYTLLALLLPNHGYGIMKFVRELTEDRVKMGTGTLYTMLGRLVDDEMISVVSEEDGKRTYQITGEGRELLLAEQERLKKQCENGERILGERL